VVEARDQPTANLAHPKPRRGECLLTRRNQFDFGNASTKGVGGGGECTKHVDDDNNPGGVSGAVDALDYSSNPARTSFVSSCER
jgi:hypothetical protein